VTYLGLTRDNRIHIGGGKADYSFNDGVQQRSDAEQAFRNLRRELGRIFPSLATLEFETTWSGVVDCSLDFSSSVGRLRDNLYYGIGYCGHGVNLTSLFGRIIADFEAGQEQKWENLPFVNRSLPYVPNEPFRWLGAQAALAYYRMSG
jgi:glycine/D-amino acid oxidase-like deaminating enzyme